MEKVKIGIIGCGNISGIYFKNLTQVFEILDIKGAVDLIRERSLSKQEEFGYPVLYETDKELLADEEIELVLNITTPPDHYYVSKMILEAGKHMYSEKPLSVTREQGTELKALANEKGLFAGGAPDTFLGGGIQTCRKLIEDGWIGTPIAATAFMVGHGHESWHPDPEFYYQKGGGPMFDMGPYYLSALVNLMGPVESVAGSTRITFPERTITSEKKYGKKVEVEIPTHVAGLLNFESGAIGTIITSFDVWGTNLPCIEIYGSLGSLSVPDPNSFGGPIKYKKGAGDWVEMPVIYGYQDNSRGLGLADMALSIRTGKKPRANIDFTYHILDIMQGIHDASDQKIVYEIKSTCEKPEPMEIDLLPGVVK